MILKRRFRVLVAQIVLVALIVLAPSAIASAVTNPQSGSIGMQGTINSPPPTQGATPTSPGNGSTTGTQPTTVSGTCPTGTLVKIYDNGVFVGSVMCTNGAFSLQIDLFSGANSITAVDYDALNQAGPTTNAINITFSGPAANTLGTQLTLTSSYAERGANPGQTLSWPIIINGGTPPYAVDVNWGDGQPDELLSEASGGTIEVSHTYSSAGTYTVIVKATDANGQTAFLQVVGVANGPIGQSNTKNSAASNTITKTEVIWWPSVVAFPLLLVTFWLGRRYELGALRKRLERQERL